LQSYVYDRLLFCVNLILVFFYFLFFLSFCSTYRHNALVTLWPLLIRQMLQISGIQMHDELETLKLI